MAFPGGKQERGETDRQTAERETMEEVGIDLSRGFLFLGRLNDRNIRIASGKRIMVLCAFGKSLPLLFPLLLPPNPSLMYAFFFF